MSSGRAISRRTLLAGVALLPLATACSGRQKNMLGPQNGLAITVYKSPT